MAQMTFSPPLPALSTDLQYFAAERGVADWVGPVLEMTRRIFSDLPMWVRLENDPEISNSRQIVVEIDASGLDEGQILAAQNRWSDNLFQVCPATHALTFRLTFA
jgi:hypothetical protein